MFIVFNSYFHFISFLNINIFMLYKNMFIIKYIMKPPVHYYVANFSKSLVILSL